MADVIATHKHINIKKSFFGLKETVVYNQTGSEVEIKQIEYTPESGKEIEKLLKPYGQCASGHLCIERSSVYCLTAV